MTHMDRPPTMSTNRSRIDPLPVGIAVGCAVAMPLLALLPFTLVFSFFVGLGPEAHPETAVFALAAYGSILAIPIVCGGGVGLIIKHFRRRTATQ